MFILLDYCDRYHLRKPKLVQLIVLVHISVIIYICNCLYLCVCLRQVWQQGKPLKLWGRWAQAARGVAASTVEPKAAAAMLDSACHVMEGSAMLINEAHEALVCPGDAESQQRLAQVGRHTLHAFHFKQHAITTDRPPIYENIYSMTSRS